MKKLKKDSKAITLNKVKVMMHGGHEAEMKPLAPVFLSHNPADGHPAFCRRYGVDLYFNISSNP